MLIYVYSPVRTSGAVYIVCPVADPELLVESSHLVTHVGHAPALSITQMEDLTVELQISVETDRLSGAVECERRIGKLLPPLHLWQMKKKLISSNAIVKVPLTYFQLVIVKYKQLSH